MKIMYSHPTSKGPVLISQREDGRFQVIWNGQVLGNYETAALAIEDVAGGHTWEPSDGTDLSALGISDSLEDWTPTR